MARKEIKIEKYLRKPDSPGDAVAGLPLFARLESEQPPTRSHVHRFTELVVVLAGRGIHVGNGFRDEIERGDLFVIPSGGGHSYENCDGLSLVNVIFNFEKLPIPLMDLHILPGFHELFPDSGTFFAQPQRYPGYRLTEAQMTGVKPLLDELIFESENFLPGREFRLLAAFMFLAGKITGNFPVKAPPSRDPVPIYQLSSLIGFINREFRNPLRQSDILKRIPMSRSTLNRNFYQAFGLTPMRYLNRLRLEHAVELLNSTALSINEIARQSGFEDSNYFTRKFREKFGIAPSAWRRHSAADSGGVTEK